MMMKILLCKLATRVGLNPEMSNVLVGKCIDQHSYRYDYGDTSVFGQNE